MRWLRAVGASIAALRRPTIAEHQRLLLAKFKPQNSKSFSAIAIQETFEFFTSVVLNIAEILPN